MNINILALSTLALLITTHSVSASGINTSPQDVYALVTSKEAIPCSQKIKRRINAAIGHSHTPHNKLERRTAQYYGLTEKASIEKAVNALLILQKSDPEVVYDCRRATTIQAFIDAGASSEEAVQLASLRGSYTTMIGYQPVVSTASLLKARKNLTTGKETLQSQTRGGVGKMGRDDVDFSSTTETKVISGGLDLSGRSSYRSTPQSGIFTSPSTPAVLLLDHQSQSAVSRGSRTSSRSPTLSSTTTSPGLSSVQVGDEIAIPGFRLPEPVPDANHTQ